MNRKIPKPVNLLLLLCLVVCIFLAVKIYSEYRHISDFEMEVHLDSARSVRELLTAYQTTYYRCLASDSITLTSATSLLVPAIGTREISSMFNRQAGHRMSIGMVSDRPRNQDNLASGYQLEALEYFRANPEAEEFAKVYPGPGDEDDDLFVYAFPARASTMCLQCHGNKEDAPAYIRDTYATGYGHEEGDLLGITSISISRHKVHDELMRGFFLRAAGSTLVLGLLAMGVIGVLLCRIRRKDLQYTRLLQEKVDSKTRELREKVKLLEEYKRVLDESSIVSKSDLEGNITYVNDKLCEQTGYSREELLGKPHSMLRHPDVPKKVFADMWKTIQSGKTWKGVFPNRCKDGSTSWNSATICPIFDIDGHIVEYIGARVNVNELIEKRQQLQRLLNFDKLTGLPNRYKLIQDLKRYDRPSLLMVDIHHFSDINDFYGIDVGDRVVQELADRVAQVIDKNPDLVMYRFYGDQLAILHHGYCRPEDLEQLCYRIMEAVSGQPFVVDEHEITVQITCGIAYRQENPLIEADIALKQAKRNRSFVEIIEESGDIKKELAKNYSWGRKLQDALHEGRIVPYYQGIVDARTGKITKYECLVRLIERDGNVVSPYFFLDIAKKARIYPKITRAVIDQAANVFAHNEFDFSINLSSEDIMDISVVEYIREKLLETPLARRVIFEILETEGLENFEQIKEFIHDVKRFGSRIAIDDFGTGYSNYERLLNLNVDFLKIDGSIIRKICEDEVSATIAQTIVMVAREIGIQTVAEFVFDEKTARVAREMGIDYLQGFYFSEPLPAIDILSGG
ncbi:EAL domain-containing protein [Desulfolithobacter sp.]